MSLLLLKTKDLSWQDHTMNVEVMLKPTQCQLLLNKHKTLETRYVKDRDLFEKQLQTYIKDYTLERRLTERYRDRLMKRKKELHQQRAQSALEKRQLADIENERSKSAPTAKSKTPSPVRHIGKRSRGVFITEIDDDRVARLPSISQKRQNSFFADLSRPKSKPKQEPKVKKKEPVSLGEKRYITLETKTEVGDETLPSSKDQDSSKEQEIIRDPLIEKVNTFVEDIRQFNIRVQSYKDPDLESLDFGKRSNVTTPLIAKRYNTFTVDMHRIEKAFDDFCKTNSKEELHKMMKLAAKLKANVALARNQSLVPTLGAFKSSRAFKRLTKRSRLEDSPSSDEG